MGGWKEAEGTTPRAPPRSPGVGRTHPASIKALGNRAPQGSMNGAPLFPVEFRYISTSFSHSGREAQKPFSSRAVKAEEGVGWGFFPSPTQNLQDRAWVPAERNSRKAKRTQEGRGKDSVCVCVCVCEGRGKDSVCVKVGVLGASTAPTRAPPARGRDLSALDQSAPTCAHLAPSLRLPRAAVLEGSR